MAADRTPNELADALERSQNSYIAEMADGHRSIIMRSKGDELAACYRLMAAAAALLRVQGEQLDTLRAAHGETGDIEWLASACLDEAMACQQVGGFGETFGETVGVLSQAAVALRRLAAAVPQDPETCACGKPATGTVAGIPTCGDDR